MVSVDTLVSVGAKDLSQRLRRTDTTVQLRTRVERWHPRVMKCCQERTASETELSRVVNGVATASLIEN